MKKAVDLSNSVDLIHNKLQSIREYADLKEQMFQKLMHSKIPPEEWHSRISELAFTSQVDERLKQFIMQVCRQTIKKEPIRDDSQDYLNKARQNWTEYLIKSVITLSNQIIAQMNQRKPPNKDHDHRQERREDDDEEEKEKDVPCIYNSYQFLRALKLIEPPKGYHPDQSTPYPLLIKCIFPVFTIEEYRKKFSDLSPKLKSLGSDSETLDFIVEREKTADGLMKKGLLSELELMIRRGAPSGKRTEIYRRLLGLDAESFAQKYKDVTEPYKDHKYIIDDVIKEDAMVKSNMKIFISNAHDDTSWCLTMRNTLFLRIWCWSLCIRC